MEMSTGEGGRGRSMWEDDAEAGEEGEHVRRKMTRIEQKMNGVGNAHFGLEESHDYASW
jgi:hypothetical protein